MASILVVEDHPIFAESVKRLLHDRGSFEVASAWNAEQAVDQIQAQPYDLVLIDISLPGRSGLWLIEAVHALKPDLPSMVLSGLALGLYVDQAMQAGARGYILKDDVPGILEGIDVVLSGGTFISAALRR